MRAILDVDVLVSALLSKTGAPAELIRRWLAGQFEVIVFPQLIEELERALAYPKVRVRIDADDAARFVGVLRELGEPVPDPDAPPPVASPDSGDDYLIAVAARERATLVSGDSHLLGLAERIPVVAPREFIKDLLV